MSVSDGNNDLDLIINEVEGDEAVTNYNSFTVSYSPEINAHGPTSGSI